MLHEPGPSMHARCPEVHPQSTIRCQMDRVSDDMSRCMLVLQLGWGGGGGGGGGG